MNNLIYLQDILPLDKLKDDGIVLLLRHYHPNLEEMIQKNLIEEYQSYQGKTAFRKGKYLIVFNGGERNTGIFYGVFEKSGILEKENLPYYSKELANYLPPQPRPREFYLELNRLKEFDRYKDRLVIDWVTPRGWYNIYGKVQDKLVIKILPYNFVKDFKGLMNVNLTFNELKTIIDNPDSNEEWYNSLSRLQAIYLILYTKTGEQYIGTTYGENGLWQRWSSYVKGDGTGGNKELIRLKEKRIDFYKDLQFSILEVLSKTASQKYSTEKESMWKEKLGTRAYGLNKN